MSRVSGARRFMLARRVKVRKNRRAPGTSPNLTFSYAGVLAVGGLGEDSYLRGGLMRGLFRVLDLRGLVGIVTALGVASLVSRPVVNVVVGLIAGMIVLSLARAFLTGHAPPKPQDEDPEKAAEMERDRANFFARVAFCVVFAAGISVVLLPAVPYVKDILSENPFTLRTTVKTVEKTSSGGETETTQTKSEANEGLIERSLAAGGLLLLRSGVVVLAAFIAAASVQRTLLGDFRIKVGPLELSEVAGSSAAALEKVKKDVQSSIDELENDVRAGLEESDAQRDQLRRFVGNGLKELARAMQEAERRISELESRGPGV
jgi:hypothetical protein